MYFAKKYKDMAKFQADSLLLWTMNTNQESELFS
jgi:hypothetical protein